MSDFSGDHSSVYWISHSYLLEVAHSFTVVLQRAFGWRIFVSLGFSNCCEKSKYRTKISVRKCSVWLQYWRSCVLKLLWSSVSCVYVQTDEISSVGECSVTERISLFTTQFVHYHSFITFISIPICPSFCDLSLWSCSNTLDVIVCFSFICCSTKVTAHLLKLILY